MPDVQNVNANRIKSVLLAHESQVSGSAGLRVGDTLAKKNHVDPTSYEQFVVSIS